MAEAHVDLPFAAEYAKSGRASCKLCSGAINKDALRIAIMVQSPMFDGKIPHWYHYSCAWKRARITTHTDIKNFDNLRWEDQKKIKDKIADGGGKGGAAGGPGGDSNFETSNFATEYAKSSRSKCRGCDDKILKDVVRVSKKDFDSQRAKMYGTQDLWYHIDCFVENRDETGFDPGLDPTKIKGYAQLRQEDKDELLSKLGRADKSKRKAESQKSGPAKKQKKGEAKEEKALREQSQLIWKIRDALNKDVSKQALKLLLEYNDQEVPTGESKILEAVSECMAFGALVACPECKEGQLVLSSTGAHYRCSGNISGWTKCQYTTRTPERKACKIPKQFKDVEFLKKYKYVKRDRILSAERVETSAIESSASGSGPLKGMTFAIKGNTELPKKDLKHKIERLGGSVVETMDKTTTACVSTKDEVDAKAKHVKEAKKLNIHVIGDTFFKECQKGGAAILIEQHSLAPWGGDPNDRIKDVVDGPAPKKSTKSAAALRDEKMFTKSMPSQVKMKVKGGAAVDPDSGMTEKAHVLLEKGEPYTAVLNMVDLASGRNSYYKLQILESDKSNNSYWVFRSWGRVGTTIGGNKLEKCGHSKSSAIDLFRDLYLEKTGNDWDDRKNFVKQPKKFFPLDIDYGGDSDEVKRLDASAGSNSRLSKPVQNLIRMIFDVDSMEKAMLEFEIDLKKMPLGKLSKKQIESAYKVLKELQNLIDNDGSKTQFLDKSNQFYTLIPHDFGLDSPPLLDTTDSIAQKSQMLDSLLEIEIAYSLLKGGSSGEKDALDVHYEKLKTDISELDKKSDEFKLLLDYVKNTHAATHNQYELEVQEIFKVSRAGEYKRYRPFEALHNRQLLWHGSRNTNYAGILSQGLRIAPPEAPVTGYMFGKGVYFADMVSKSANYCRTTKSAPVGYLLLCEVALGNMHELKQADYITKLPKGKHSTKGVGMTYPNPDEAKVSESGVTIPLGKAVQSTDRSSLLYNEFIVYDVAQINIKYMLQVDFKYKF